ncbi:MAG: histidine phosphatase family protein [Roseiflexaceae bacterium]
MNYLILVKHALPDLIPAAPAAEWRLGEAGRRGSAALAERLRPYRPAAIVASREPKATETGSIVSTILDTPFATLEGLHEHDRSNVGWLTTELLDAKVAEFFERPSDLVLGRETAGAAGERFALAVDQALAAQPSGSLVIVAHGTVITLLVAAHNDIEPFLFWKRLGLPSFVVLSLPGMALVEVVEELHSNVLRG